jgi:serine/threonine-protein kinase HipA
MRKAEIIMHERMAGILSEDENGYHFAYSPAYLHSENPEAISRTLPIRDTEFRSSVLFPFFDGLIPEGWLLQVAEKNWKLNARDRMGLLLACCRDCIGAVSVRPIEDADE